MANYSNFTQNPIVSFVIDQLIEILAIIFFAVINIVYGWKLVNQSFNRWQEIMVEDVYDENYNVTIQYKTNNFFNLLGVYKSYM